MSRSRISPRPEDIDLMARIAYAEAANQGDVGLAAVMHVVKNRVESGRWGNSVHDVVYANMQFEPTRTEPGRAKMASLSGEELERLRAMATAVMTDEMPDITGGADHFANAAIQRDRGHIPQWMQDMAGSADQIGDHTFFGGDPEMARRLRESPEVQAAFRDGVFKVEGLISGIAAYESLAFARELMTTVQADKAAGRETVISLDGKSGRPLIAAQKGLMDLAAKLGVALNDEQKTQLYAEMGRLPDDEAAQIAAMSAEDRAKLLETRQLVKIGDAYFDMAKANAGDASKQLTASLTEAFGNLSPEQQQALLEETETRIAEQQERNRNAARDAGLGAGLDMFGMMILAMMMYASGQTDLANSLVAQMFGQEPEADNALTAATGGGVGPYRGGGGVQDLTTLNDAALRGLIEQPIEASTTREAVVSFAERFVGKQEQGRNGGALVQWVNGYTGDPWCGGFVDKMLDQAFESIHGKPLTGYAQENGGSGRLSAAYYEELGKRHGAFHAYGSRQPQPGDIIFFDVPSNASGRHVGMVHSIDANGNIVYIAGNEGDQVVKRVANGRDGGSGPIVGFTSVSDLARALHGVDVDAPTQASDRVSQVTPRQTQADRLSEATAQLRQAGVADDSIASASSSPNVDTIAGALQQAGVAETKDAQSAALPPEVKQALAQQQSPSHSLA